MSNFVIFGDSTCDLNKELREKYDIEYVAMNFSVDDTEYVASLDWDEKDAKAHYDIMRGGKRVFTTQVPRTVFYDTFKAVFILYVLSTGTQTN